MGMHPLWKNLLSPLCARRSPMQPTVSRWLRHLYFVLQGLHTTALPQSTSSNGTLARLKGADDVRPALFGARMEIRGLIETPLHSARPRSFAVSCSTTSGAAIKRSLFRTWPRSTSQHVGHLLFETRCADEESLGVLAVWSFLTSLHGRPVGWAAKVGLLNACQYWLDLCGYSSTACSEWSFDYKQKRTWAIEGGHQCC